MLPARSTTLQFEFFLFEVIKIFKIIYLNFRQRIKHFCFFRIIFHLFSFHCQQYSLPSLVYFFFRNRLNSFASEKGGPSVLIHLDDALSAAGNKDRLYFEKDRYQFYIFLISNGLVLNLFYIKPEFILTSKHRKSL